MNTRSRLGGTADLGPHQHGAREGDVAGFVTTDPSAYGPVLAKAIPGIAQWLGSALAGPHPTGPMAAAFELPLFRAEDGRAPALFLDGPGGPEARGR